MNNNDIIRHRLEQGLSGVIVSPQRRMKLMDEIIGGKKVKRKLTYGLILAIVCTLLAASAIAVTISAVIQQNMQKVVDMQNDGSFERWGLNEKMRFINLISHFNVAMDEKKKAQLSKTGNSTKELDVIADELISEVYLEYIQSQIPDYVIQPEKHPIPDFYSIFKDLWLRENPNESDDTIRKAYDAWEKGQWQQSNASPEVAQSTLATDKEIRLSALSYLSEVLSFSNKERASCHMDVSYLPSDKIWVASINISKNSLQQGSAAMIPSRAVLSNDNYSWDMLLDEEAAVMDYENLTDFEYANLIPLDTLFGVNSVKSGNTLRAFQNLSIEQKAEFSQKWKPIVDAWLNNNPQYLLRFREQWYDTTFLATRHVYGVPLGDVIDQTKAKNIAMEYYIKHFQPSMTVADISALCEIYYYYDITNSSLPLWKISLTTKEYMPNNSLQEGFHVIIDAKTGTVIDAYTMLSPGKDSFAIAERLM